MRDKLQEAAPATCRVIVTVRGGVADIMHKPIGVEVCVIDYDVEGEDIARLDRDSHGDACCIQRHAAGEEIIDAADWPARP